MKSYRSPEPVFFEDLADGVAGATIFLDVDGTLVSDGESELSPDALRKVRELASGNQVLLCTNKRDPARWQTLESTLGLPVVTKYHRKPSRGVLTETGVIGEKRVVIGDKFLIDYLFAHRIGATFIKVKRKLSGTESLGVKLVNVLDNFVWSIVSRF